MPTPSQQEHEIAGLSTSTPELSIHSSCPPASAEFDIAMPDGLSHPVTPAIDIPEPFAAFSGPKDTTNPLELLRDASTPVSSIDDGGNVADLDQRPSSRSIPASASPDPKSASPLHSSATSGTNDLFPMTRYRPNYTSSLLKPGARFSGTQRSERQEYEVTVDIQHVDIEQSFLCGYLKIRGLSDAHPTLTTFFEGEMIGTKYNFVTQHPEWGANEKVDWQHWGRFPAWRPIQKDAKKPNFLLKNWMHKENIWMRWKEYFVVPDHTITDLPGASFDGFYYICFNQITGVITGAYYHHKSEQFQHLELHPEDAFQGYDIGFEFR